MALLVALVVVAVAVSLGLASLISRPLKKLVGAAERLSQGDLMSRAGISSKDEIGRLGVAFDGMAARLQESHDNLEQQVRERTRELSTTNEQLRKEITERERVERELRESEERFRQMSDVEAIVIHEKGVILAANQAMANMFGYDISEVTGMTVLEFAAPESRDIVMHNALSGYEEPYEAHGLRKDGSTFPGEVHGKPMTYQGRTVRVTVLRDITERKRAEEALTYQAQLLENVNDAVISADERFVTTAWNRAAEKMYGWTAEEIIGRPTVELLQPEFVDVEPDEVYRRLLEEGSFEGEVIHPRKDGTRIHTEARAIALRDKDGHITGFVSIDRDITERKRAEEALRLRNEQLQALQGRLVSTSKLASVGAVALDLAHQIRNPLTTLLGRLEGLQDTLAPGSQGRRHLDIAMEAGWRIQQVTDRFAAIGQQESVQLDVAGLLDEAYGMAELGSGKRIETRREYQEELPRVRGNPTLLREALSNVFSNSLDALDDGGLITIVASQAGGTVTVRVSDNGTGIPTEDMAHLFEPFYSTKPNGYGLGLFAARHILELHRGSVELDSVEGAGTIVTITLPSALSSDATITAREGGTPSEPLR